MKDERRWARSGDFAQDLGLDDGRELVGLAERDHERADSSDDAVRVVSVQVTELPAAHHLRDPDCQPIDRDALGHGMIGTGLTLGPSLFGPSPRHRSPAALACP